MPEPQTSIAQPSYDEFAALLEESLAGTALQEGSVVKGTVVSIEKDVALIDVDLKTEGRVPLKEFSLPGRPSELSVGDQVDVYLERVENSAGEAVLSREKARQHGLAGRILNALEIHVDLVADGKFGRAARKAEFLQGNAALGLQADVDEGDVLLDANDGAFDNTAFL